MSRNVKNKTGKKHAGTQTLETDKNYYLEIARLEEQVKLLKIENEVLRKYTVENPSDVLKDGIHKKSPRDSKISPDNNFIEPVRQKSIRAQSLTKSTSKPIIKGCSCKGVCASSKCGCVRKENKCGELCRCNNASCQNQEHSSTETNKENVDNVNTEILLKEKRVANKHLQNVNAGKGLFSPDVGGQDTDLNDEQFRTVSLHFGSPKKLTFESDEENEKADKKVRSKFKKGDNHEKETHQSRNASQKNNLKVPNAKYTRKHRSSSNEEKRPKNDLEVEKHELRRCISSEMEIQSDEDVEISKQGKKDNNYLKNVLQGMAPLRRGKQKVVETNTTEDTGTNPESNKQDMQSKAVGHENKKTDDKKTKKNTKSNKEGLHVTDKSKSSVKESGTDTSHSTADASVSPSQDQTNIHEEINKENRKENQFEEDFDPMKPKHQLPRTPTRGSTETSPHDVSEVPLPLPVTVFTEEEEEQPLPEDFHQAEVDWAQYQAQLVACGKCKRKFHPFRIKKHEACCKKV